MLFVPDNFNKVNIKFITEAQKKIRDYLSLIFIFVVESQKPKTNYRLLTKFIGIIPSLNLLYEKKDMQKEVDFREKGFA